MLTLRLLGAVEIAGPAGVDLTAVGRQPKRLALLGYLCLAGRDGWCRRDTLLALFWPELDTPRARAALRQALHYLRQHLGPDVIRTRGEEELGVDAARLACDAVLVHEALHARRWEEAAARYRGDFFAGLHVAAADADLEHWVERERQRLLAGVVHAVEALRRDADERDDREAAARWARRATELAPLDEAAARRLIRRLVAVTDISGALAEAHRVSTALRAEGQEPSERLESLALQVRAYASSETPLPARIPSYQPRHSPRAQPAVVGGGPPDEVPPPSPRPLPRRSPIVEPPSAPLLTRDTGPMPAIVVADEPRRTPRLTLAALGLLALVLAAAVWRGAGPGAAPRRAPADSVTAASPAVAGLYREGLAQLRRGDRRTAHQLFEAALRGDSGFAMAALMSSRTTGPGEDSVARARIALALRLAPRASERERLTIRAAAFRLTSDPALYPAAESLARRWPADAEARTLHAEALAYAGRHAEALRDSREALALTLDTAASVGCARCGLERVMLDQLFALDSIPALEREARARLAGRVGAATDDWPRWFLEVALRTEGRCDAADSVRRLGPAEGQPARLLAAPAELAACRGDYAEAARLLGEATAAAPRSAASELAWLRVIAARAAGRPVEALALAARACDADALGENCRTPVLAATATTLRDAGRAREAATTWLALAAWRSPEWVPGSGGLARHLAWNLTHAADALVEAGDLAGALRLADSVEVVGRGSGFGRDAVLHHFVRGRVLAARGDTAGAIAAMRRAYIRPRLGYVRINLELGRLLAAAGQAREAVHVLDAGINPGLPESAALYATVPELRLALADAYERVGDRASAAAQLGLVLHAWRDAEAGVRARRDAVGARLAALAGAAATGR